MHISADDTNQLEMGITLCIYMLRPTFKPSGQLKPCEQGRRKLIKGGAAEGRDDRGRAAAESVSARSAEHFLDRFFNDKEAALVAARYIKGHHVCCFS